MVIYAGGGTGSITAANGIVDAWRLSDFDLWSLVFVRVRWDRMSGSGTDTASFTANIKHADEALFDLTLHTIAGAGVGSDVFLRVPKEERDQFTFTNRDQPSLIWTNADANIRWAWRIGIENA